LRPNVSSAEAGPVGLTDAAREGAARLAGPAVAFAVALARILFGRDVDESYVVPTLFVAVVVGAALGGRWSALATVAIVAVGLALTATPEVVAPTIVAIAAATAIGLATGELRDRAERAERGIDVANQRLRRLALRDTLTGLLDRRGFDFALGIELAREARRGGRFGVVLFEIGGLKNANERFGRSVGDTLLQVFGDSLETRIRQSDIAARVGGDQFAVILPDADARGAEVAADQIMDAFMKNVRGILPGDLEMNGSYGVARFPEDGNAPDALLAAAARAREAASPDDVP
jgi:diguanylate cyclase (GGDEF)-like protein